MNSENFAENMLLECKADRQRDESALRRASVSGATHTITLKPERSGLSAGLCAAHNAHLIYRVRLLVMVF